MSELKTTIWISSVASGTAQTVGGPAMIPRSAKVWARKLLPAPVFRWIRNKWRRTDGGDDALPAGEVRFGDLRRLTPISMKWGWDRGVPVDRYYIEKFLAQHASDINGRVLEIGDDTYTKRFGGDRVTAAEVLDIDKNNPHATIVEDLTVGHSIPSESFDCIIFTQTLQSIYDGPAAMSTLHRILKPGGFLLATFPGISHLGYGETRKTFSWNYTSLSAQKQFAEFFGDANVKVEAFGNVLTTICFLHGLAARELRTEELDFNDPAYPFLITVRAVKRT
jgi:SAM-dependent methyltransferase